MEKVTIYTTKTCPFCRASKHLLKERGLEFEEIDITDDCKLQESLYLKTSYETVPLIFFGKKFIGGFEAIKEMDERGQLKQAAGRAA